MSHPQLSVVAPLHNEQENTRPLFEAIRDAMEPLGRSFEVLLVNDGSTDRTGEILEELAAGDGRLRPIHLDGNFGEAAALCAGFELSRGEVVLTLDGDLQNDPADLPRLLQLLEQGGYRAVSGRRRKRAESFALRVLPSRVANRLIAAATGVPSHDNGCGLKAYRAEVVRGVYLPHGFHRFMPAIFGVRAHEFADLEVVDRARTSGRSHYGLSRLFAVIRDLLAVRYVLADPQGGQTWMTTLLAVGILFLVAAPVLAIERQVASAAIIALVGAATTSYAACVRSNLRRWIDAQRYKTFRIRGSSATLGEHAALREVARARGGARV